MTDRAEQAFREAFRIRTDATPEPIAVAPPPRGPRRWLTALIAAGVALIVAVPVTIIATQQRQPGVPVATPAPTRLSQLPGPDSGYTWVSRHGVAAQVPEGWVPSSLEGCPAATEGRPRGYANPEAGPCPAVGRPDLAVAFLTAGETPPDGPAETRAIGNLTLWVGLPHDPTDQQRAGAAFIVDSAILITHDQFGCPTDSPFKDVTWRPTRWDLASADDYASLTYCSYSATEGGPTVDRSWPFKMDDATTLLRALKAAPEVTETRRCDAGRSALLRVLDGSGFRDLSVNRDCGIDDGTKLVEFTPAVCHAIFGSTFGLEVNGGDVGDCPPLPQPTPRPTPTAPDLSVLPAAKQGWRWIVRDDAAIQVPATWLDSNWSWEGPCVGTMPDGPYVSTPEGEAPTRECPERDVPEAERPRIMHLAVVKPTAENPGLPMIGTEVGSVAFWVIFSDTQHAVGDENALAIEIIDTAVPYQP